MNEKLDPFVALKKGIQLEATEQENRQNGGEAKQSERKNC